MLLQNFRKHWTDFTLTLELWRNAGLMHFSCQLQCLALTLFYGNRRSVEVFWLAIGKIYKYFWTIQIISIVVMKSNCGYKFYCIFCFLNECRHQELFLWRDQIGIINNWNASRKKYFNLLMLRDWHRRIHVAWNVW